jgi:hypothetical protein
MMHQTLGGFGDARLEKGGPCFWRGWLRQAVTEFESGGWVAIVLARYDLRGFCEIQP